VSQCLAEWPTPYPSVGPNFGGNMQQSKLESLIEVNTNIATGFIVSYIFWTFFLVDWIEQGYVTIHDNFIITMMFTVIAVIRGYLWRRFFNAGFHKLVHQWVIR